MRKNLLLALTLLSATLNAQVTEIKPNKSIDVTNGVPLSNNKAVIVSDIDKTLWVTDGTPGGTFQLSSTITLDNNPEGAVLNGKYIFSGSTSATGEDLFITDGTVAGTGLLKDINAGAQGSLPNDFALFNGALYFSAVTAAQGRELWKTDGTTAGTTLVKDIVPGAVGSNDADDFNLFSNGNYLLLSVTTPASGNELWKSDGTSAGTNLLKDINAGAASSNPSGFSKYNNLVLFTATDPTTGTEVWRTDGTPGGTVLLKDINPGVNGSISTFGFFSLNVFKGQAIFTADDGTHGAELWSTDGTAQNTKLIKDIEPGAAGGVGFFFSVFPVGDKFIFTASTSATGVELWESDGTEAGTKLFKDIAPGPAPSAAIILPPFAYDINTGNFNYTLFKGNKFFFVAATPQTGAELWISDGTPAGTTMLKDIYPGEEHGATISSLIYTSTALFFNATDGVHGEELWKSDGTSAGTTMVANINTQTGDDGEEGSDISFFPFIINNKVIFEANNGDDPAATDLYVLDGNFSSLPVILGEFTVTPKNNDAILKWSTLTEVNTKDFTIQRSDNGIDFTSIGSISANGTSSQKQTYSYIDAGIMNSGKEKVHYRLLMTDKDGKSEKSRIISLKLKGSAELKVKVLKNPVESQVEVMLTGVTKDVRISVKDISGKIITTRSGITGNGQVSLSTGNLIPGIYLLVAETDSERQVIQFVKR